MNGVPPPAAARLSPRRVPVWHLVAAQLGVITLVIAAVGIAARLFPLLDWITEVEAALDRYGIWTAVAYPFAFAVCNLLLLPGGILSMGAGYFFGLWGGFALALSGTLLGAAGAFLIGRRWARRLVEHHLLDKPRWLALDRAVEREGWRIVMLSQLNPLFPTSLIDYIYGITGIGFWRCMSAIAIGQTPGLFLYAYFGTLGQFGFRIATGASEPSLGDYWLWGAGAAVALTITVALGLIASRLWRETREARDLASPD